MGEHLTEQTKERKKHELEEINAKGNHVVNGCPVMRG